MKYIQDALLELLSEKNMDNIKVQEVCDKANISRQTVYYHYSSLGEVFITWLETELTERLESKNTYKHWVDGYKEILLICSENRKEVTNVYNSSYRDEMMKALDDFGRDLVATAVETIADNLSLPLMRRDKDFMTRVYMYVFMGILEDYLKGDLEDNIDYIVSRCEMMLGESIRRKETELFELYKIGKM